MDRPEVSCKEYIQRPASAPCLRLDKVHHVLVYIRTLFTVDFNAYKVIIQVIGGLSIRECPGGHDVTPVACGVSHLDQQWLALSDGMAKGLPVPFLPPYRVSGMLPQVRGGGSV